jgi:hypothetical protein
MAIVYPSLLRSFPAMHVVVLSIIPPTLIFVYVANLLMFTDEVGSLSAGYPRRMFTLPVTTRTLVLWPMVIATVSVVTLWLAIALLLYYPGGYHPPLDLPALAIAVAITWNQVVAWSPIQSYLIRVYAAIIGFFVLLGWPCLLVVQKQASEQGIVALGCVELCLLFATGVLAVNHSRRGVDWSFGMERAVDWFWSVEERLTRPSQNFQSPARAQDWYESRCHGSFAVGMMGFIVGSVALMQLFVSPEKTLAFRIGLGSMLSMPFVMAGSMGSVLGRVRPLWAKYRRLMTFLAVRPMTTGELVEAKYRLATRVAVQTWLVTVATVAAVILIKGQGNNVAEILRGFLGLYPGWRGATILVLAILFAPVYIWKLLTDSLVPMLTGRRWIADGSVFLAMIILFSIIAAGLWYPLHPEYVTRHLPIIIWLLALVVLVKAVAAGFTFRVALGRGLLHGDSLVRLAVAWTLMAAVTIALVLLVLPATRLPVPVPVMALAALAMMPLGRFALAPLALEWNRRR